MDNVVLRIIVSAIVFGLCTVAFVLTLAKYPIFSSIMLVAMFVSYWLGRFWQDRINSNKMKKEIVEDVE